MNLFKSVIIVLSLSLIFSACSAPSSPTQEQVQPESIHIVVTSDYGREILVEQTLPYSPNLNALAALQQVASIETAYGGGFVKGINGLSSSYHKSSSGRDDWFFYINGMMSNTGALDYNLHNGDTEYWDFHDWSFQKFNPAVIGLLPEPFLHGFRGQLDSTIVAYSDDLEAEAQSLERLLASFDITPLTTRPVDDLSQSEKESGNLVLIGTQDTALISEINQQWKRLGFFANFSAGKLITFNSNGQQSAEYTSATGLIEATQNPWNPDGTGACENVVWLITGTDAVGVRSAVDFLCQNTADLRFACAAVITQEGITGLPQ